MTMTTNKDTSKSAHKRSLARALAVRRHVVATLRKLQAKERMSVVRIGDGHGPNVQD